jgi:hypothetical protein
MITIGTTGSVTQQLGGSFPTPLEMDSVKLWSWRPGDVHFTGLVVGPLVFCSLRIEELIRSQKGFFAKRFFGIRCFGATFQTQAESQPPHEGFPQRGRAAERPATFVGGGRRPPPLWRLAFGLSLGFCSKASNIEKPLCGEPLLRPYEQQTSFSGQDK